jgi:hypothetical protein
MTPQEKAEELLHKFLNCKDVSGSYYVVPIYEDASRCALIVVEELLSETEERDGMRVINNSYWMEVRNEIEKI